MLSLSPLLPLAIGLGIVLIFNPLSAFQPRNEIERWTTRERSFGYPYYWKMRYCTSGTLKNGVPSLGWNNNNRFPWCGDGNKGPEDTKGEYYPHHPDVYNRSMKKRCFIKNVMYIE